MKLNKFFAVVACGFLLTSCAGAGKRSITVEEAVTQRGYFIGDEVSDIPHKQSSDFYTLGQSAVIFNDDRKDAFLAYFSARCRSLPEADVIATTSHDSRLSKNNAVLVIVKKESSERCIIGRINKLTVNEEQTAIRKYSEAMRDAGASFAELFRIF